MSSKWCYLDVNAGGGAVDIGPLIIGLVLSGFLVFVFINDPRGCKYPFIFRKEKDQKLE